MVDDNIIRHCVVLEYDLPNGSTEIESMRPDVYLRHHDIDVGEWVKTEGDESADYDYLGESWENGVHRKWVAELTEDQLRAFLTEYAGEEPYPRGADTCGILGFGGVMPAYAIESIDDGWGYATIGSCYVAEYVYGPITDLTFPS